MPRAANPDGGILKRDPTEEYVDRLPSVAVLGLGTLISHGFGLSLAPAMLPWIADGLDVGYAVLGAALAIGLVSYAAGAVTASRVLRAVPSRGLLVGSYVATAAGLLAAAAAQSANGLAIAVALTGFVAPISWAVTIHVAGVTTDIRHRGAVMASASGGAALGVLINGILVQTTDSIHSWRVSFVIAAALALLPLGLAWLVYRRPIQRPTTDALAAGVRAVLRSPTGRLVVVASSVAGIAGFPFATFLTATAVDEMGSSAFAAGGLWWLVGFAGIAAGPLLGGFGDRRTPVHALLALSIFYLLGLVVLVSLWSHVGLVIAVLGFAAMNYPIWGILGAAANRDFDTALAVRAITLGLAGAALTGAAGNAVAGRWIETTSSFRGPVAVIATLMAGLAIWLSIEARNQPAPLDRAVERP